MEENTAPVHTAENDLVIKKKNNGFGGGSYLKDPMSSKNRPSVKYAIK